MNRRNLLIGGIGAVVVLVGAVWFFFLRSDAPPPATLEDAVAAVTSTTEAPAAEPEEAPAETIAPPTTEAAREGLDGTWTVDQNLSFVGYRIDEELANLGSVTAVGRTSEIQASLDYAGTSVSSLSVTVDMTTLESDRSLRDNAMSTRGLETNTFPEASFLLTESFDLGAVPVDGRTFGVGEPIDVQK